MWFLDVLYFFAMVIAVPCTAYALLALERPTRHASISKPDRYPILVQANAAAWLMIAIHAGVVHSWLMLLGGLAVTSVLTVGSPSIFPQLTAKGRKSLRRKG